MCFVSFLSVIALWRRCRNHKNVGAIIAYFHFDIIVCCGFFRNQAEHLQDSKIGVAANGILLYDNLSKI